MSYYNLDRAARDPYYRIAYEDRQRQEADARKVSDMLAAGRAKASTQPAGTPASSFSFSSSPSVSYSSHTSSGGGDGLFDSLKVGAVSLVMMVAFALVSGAATVWMLGQAVTLPATIFCGLLCLGIVGVVANFWRPIAGALALVALLWAARHIALLFY